MGRSGLGNDEIRMTNDEVSCNLGAMSAERYWLSKNGEVTGPFWRGKVMQMRAAGEIGEADQLCKDGTEEWVNAEEELQFLAWSDPVKAPALVPQKRYPKLIIRRETVTGGIVLIVIGALFSPCLIGIPFFIWGCCIVSRPVYGCGACGNVMERTAGVCGTCGSHAK